MALSGATRPSQELHGLVRMTDDLRTTAAPSPSPSRAPTPRPSPLCPLPLLRIFLGRRGAPAIASGSCRDLLLLHGSRSTKRAPAAGAVESLRAAAARRATGNFCNREIPLRRPREPRRADDPTGDVTTTEFELRENRKGPPREGAPWNGARDLICNRDDHSGMALRAPTGLRPAMRRPRYRSARTTLRRRTDSSRGRSSVSS